MANCIRPNPYNKRRLPCAWIDIILERYSTAPNRGAWQDANLAWKAYNAIKNSANKDFGIFDPTDVPEPPDFSQYPDNNKPREPERDLEAP